MQGVLVYTTHRSGSMFLHELLARVADELRLPHYSINSIEFRQEIRRESWKRFIEARHWPAFFGPVRVGASEPSFPEHLDRYRVILHVRDPRDVLTSLFFACAFSHKRSPGGFNPNDDDRERWIRQGIDQFVMEHAPEYSRRYQAMVAHLLHRDNTVFVRYEDMVSEFWVWLSDFLSAFAGLPVPSRRILGLVPVENSLASVHKRLYKRYRESFSAKDEDVHRHKRQITPGDHRRKLHPDTVGQLNAEFLHSMDALGYT